MKRFVLPILVLCLVLLVTPAAAGAMTYDDAVDQLVADGYTIEAENYLTGLGDSALGFRIAGSPAEIASSQYVYDELKLMGLSDVAKEAVPVDAWEFRGASVTTPDGEITASSFAGVPGTDGAISAELVYVGQGSRQEFDGAGPVAGKIVLADIELDDSWMNFIGAEATLRGARGVIMTYGENSYPWYAFPDALGGNDGEYDDDWVPMVYVAWQDGDALKAKLAEGPLAVSMELDVTLTLAENGGTGYNVIGVLPGEDPSLEPILLASHVDAHFRAGLDDTGAVVNELLMAKAMKMADVRPERSIIFFFTCGEEYGYTDCWYDWAIGAWYAITEEHPDWAGNLALMLNIEAMAQWESPYGFRGYPEVVNAMTALADQYPELLPYGYVTADEPSTWTDQWSFNAMGVPTVTTSATAGDEYDLIYHTDLETKELVDHDYLGSIAKFQGRVLQALDSGVLPYDLSARGDQLLAGIKAGKLIRAGVGKRAAANFQAAAAAFRNAAWQWELRKAATPEAKVAAVNRELIAIEKALNVRFVGREQWDWPAYQFEAPVIDSIYLTQAITAAKAGNIARAQQMITWYVGINWWLEVYSVEVCRQDLARHYPDHPHVTWGGINAPLVVDCIDEWIALGEGDTATAIAGLEEDRAMVQADLREKVADMTAVLKDLTKEVDAL